MAIYDPPDGTIDARPRCVGNCCKSFSLEYPYATVVSEFEKSKNNPEYVSFISGIETIGKMLIPLGVYRGQETFSCKNLGKQGNCEIYEFRPQMCRDFPGPSPCPYRNCASHGPQNIVKRAWNWLRD